MMAGRTRQAGGKDLIPARAVAWLAVAVVLFGAALAFSDHLAPASYLGAMDPNVVWEVLIGGVVICAFLASVAFSIHSALRRVRRSQACKSAFVSSALNNLSHGVVMTDPQRRVVFCNDRYLDIYGLSRADIPKHPSASELLTLQRQRGGLDCSTDDFHAQAAKSEELITSLPNGKSILG